jgi:dihydrofolate reductase
VRTLTYFIAMSVDGYIAGPTGEIDMFPLPQEYLTWLGTDYPETLPTMAREALGIDAPNRKYDTIVMGRATYDPALKIDVADPYAHLRTVVVSRSLSQADHPDVEICSGDPVERVRQLKAEEGLGVYLAGGAKLAGAVREEIDEVIVKIYPIMLGAGVPVLDSGFSLTSLRRTDIRTFDSGHVILSYVRDRSTTADLPSTP